MKNMMKKFAEVTIQLLWVSKKCVSIIDEFTDSYEFEIRITTVIILDRKVYNVDFKDSISKVKARIF